MRLWRTPAALLASAGSGRNKPPKEKENISAIVKNAGIAWRALAARGQAWHVAWAGMALISAVALV